MRLYADFHAGPSTEYLMFFLFLKNHQNRPTFIKFTQLFRASFPGKQVLSLTSEPTYFRASFGLFRRLFLSFLLKNEFEIRFSLVFFHCMTKSTSDHWSGPSRGFAKPFNSRGRQTWTLTSLVILDVFLILSLSQKQPKKLLLFSWIAILEIII